MPSLLAYSILPLCFAREITFPPVSGFAGEAYQLPFSGSLQSDIDVSTGSAFNGLTTFANLPYVHCLSNNSDIEKYDIAFLGAPFDTVRKLRLPSYNLVLYSLSLALTSC